MSLEMASSGLGHGLSAATGPFPVRIVSVEGLEWKAEHLGRKAHLG